MVDSVVGWEPRQWTQWSAGSPGGGLSGRLKARVVDTGNLGGGLNG